MIWLGGPLPSRLAGLVATFRQHHPDWELRWWHESDIDALGLTNRDVYDAAEDIVPADSVHQLRSDIARYEILYRHGGMYVDCDYRWQRPIDSHLRGHRLVCGWETQGTWVANGVIASVPRHAALGEAIADIPNRVATRNPVWRANRLTGPHMWTPIARRHAYILPQRLLCPVPWDHPERADDAHPGAVAVHTWNHQRTLRGIDA
jgi:mannosyltransferase OCH1-like enzyme